MKLKLKRRYFNEKYTIGTLYINDVYFCETLEDKVRDLKKERKIYGHTAIPYGTYKVILDYSPHFKRKLPHLLNVPFFSGIRIHRGNFPKDTLGCVLLGENKKKGMVLNSTVYEIDLTKAITEAIKNKEDISIEIV